MTANFDFKKHFSKQKLTENIKLKITSLVAAIFLWLVVVNFTDPMDNKKYTNVPVTIINQEVITGNGKTFEVVDNSAIVSTITIRAPRSVIRELGTSEDSISVTADMNMLLKDGISVPLNITTTKYSDKIESTRSSSEYLKVNIENKQTIQLPLEATTSGDIESGYIIGNVIPAQNQVRVSGPESVINRIKNAKVDVQVTGFKSDISTQADIMLFDSNGDGIPTGNLELNVSSVKVDVEILATKKVPIVYSTVGTPADGYGVTGEISCNPETVVIAGHAGIIDDITGITIPSEKLNITGQTTDLLCTVNVKEYLPDGIRLADPTYNGKASVTVYVEAFKDEKYGVYLKNVEIENVPSGFEASFSEKSDMAEFYLTGLSKDLEKVSVSNLTIKVDFDDYVLLHDVTELREGTYQCYLVMSLPSGLQMKEPVAVGVKLTKMDRNEEE